ncbi:MAG: hypothetical protein ABI629_12395 [bacterium]
MAAVILMSAFVAYIPPVIAQTPAQRDQIEDICNAYLATGGGDLQPRVDPFSAEGERLQQRLATLVSRWRRQYSDDILWRTGNGGYAFTLCAGILSQGVWPPLAPGTSCKAPPLPKENPCALIESGTCGASIESGSCAQARNIAEHERCTPLVKTILSDQCSSLAAAAKVRCDAYPEACARAKAAKAARATATKGD